MMKKGAKTLQISARIFSALVLVIGLPFYFGYGSPLPFIKPEYTMFDNIWLCVFPVIFIGLILGWFREKAGGWLVVISVLTGEIATLVLKHEIIAQMLVPMAAGVLFLFSGYIKDSLSEK